MYASLVFTMQRSPPILNDYVPKLKLKMGDTYRLNDGRIVPPEC